LLDGFILRRLPSSVQGARVLIVRIDAIGDFVVWLDAAKALVRHYHSQGYSVILLGNKVWSGWASEIGLFDEVWEIDVIQLSNDPSYRWNWLRRIRQEGFKIALQPTYSRVFLTGDTLVRASGAVERIGLTGGEIKIKWWLQSWSNRWYTRLIPATPMPLMELKRNAEFIRGLGLAEFQAGLPFIPQASLAQVDWLPQQPYAVLVPAASWAGREWPIENFIRIGQRLMVNGLKIVVVGESADRERIGALIDGLSGDAVDLVGGTRLGELAEVLRSASVVLTNETSALHIGAAVGAPVVCILGGGHYGRFAPYELEVTEDIQKLPIIVAEQMPCYGCDWNCKYPRKDAEAVKCIRDISVEKVWGAVEMALTKHREMVKHENVQA
jgi:ADP-heptose:LPS heptosyltransferase